MSSPEVRGSENLRSRIFTVPTGDITGLNYQEKLRSVSGLSYVSVELGAPQIQKPQGKEETDLLLLLPGEFKKVKEEQHLSIAKAPWDALPSALLNAQDKIPQGWTFTDMETITVRYGLPFRFCVLRRGGYLRLLGLMVGFGPSSLDLVAVRVLHK